MSDFFQVNLEKIGSGLNRLGDSLKVESYFLRKFERQRVPMTGLNLNKTNSFLKKLFNFAYEKVKEDKNARYCVPTGRSKSTKFYSAMQSAQSLD
jgi:hypothetical protein